MLLSAMPMKILTMLKFGRRLKKRHSMNMLNLFPKVLIPRSVREEFVFQADRDRESVSRELFLKIRRYLFSMKQLQLLIMRLRQLSWIQ